MKKIYALLCAIFILATAKGQDSYGQDFWIAIPQGFSSPTEELYITAQTTCNVTVSIPGLAYSNTFAVTANTLSTLVLPSSVQVTASGISNRGIHITATADVTVYMMSQEQATTDAYLALPVDALGMDYHVMSYNPDFSSYPGMLTVVATENNTTITVNPKIANSMSLPVNTNTNVVLNQGQVYQIKSVTTGAAGDFTGSKVSSDKPVAVFGSVQCTNIPNSTYACDFIIEQMPPNSAWGTSFVATSLATRTGGDIFKFLAKDNSTSVSVNGSVVAALNAGQQFETSLPSNSVFKITANNPILVGQFCKGSDADGVVSDPFFALVPPDDQFLVNYIISSGTPNIPNNFANITSPTSNTGNVQVDGVAVGAGLWTVIPSTTFSSARVPLASGVHSITSVLPIGVLAYGYGNYDSYGYLGGQSFSPVATVSQMSLNVSLTTSIQAQKKCVIATVLDQNNNPVPGVLVNFTVSGANAGAAGFGITDGSGNVTLCYQTCFAGQDILTATIAGLSAQVTINVASSILSVTPTTLSASAGVQSCVTATMLDGSNIPVPNAFVTFTVTGTNAAPGVTLQTDAAGQIQFCYTPANSGADVITLTAGCVGGNSAAVNVTVGGGGNPCPPGPTITIIPSGLKANPWGNGGANDPYTFYYGLSNTKLLKAKIIGGVGPYTYAWTSSGGPSTLKQNNLPPNQINLFEPAGPVTVTLTITDQNNNCQYSQTITINWSDYYFCNHLPYKPWTWFIYVCQGVTPQCVPWDVAKAMLTSNPPTATLGPCTPKTDITNQVTSFSVYPNPSSGLFTLEMPIAADSKGSVEVMDVNGRALYSESIEIQEGVLYHSIDLSALPNGIYVVRVATDNEFATERIQIIR